MRDATEESQNFAVAIAVKTPAGFPLVSDPQKPEPRYWKFPGGRNRAGEAPLETALRELEEETGITLPAGALTLLFQETRRGQDSAHEFFLFHAQLPEAPHVVARGEGGELVKFFTLDEIKKSGDFFPNHRALLNRL